MSSKEKSPSSTRRSSSMEKSDDKKSTDTVGDQIEARMNIVDFRKIMEMFAEADDFVSFTRDQFIAAMQTIGATGTQEEFGQMFDRIDVAKEGSVNWDKFASHMLLEFYEKDDKVKSTQVPHWNDLKVLATTVHKDIIQGIAFLKSNNRYIAISKEGSVTLWNMDLRLQRSLRTSSEACRLKDLWVTDFIPLPPSINKIALSLTSKEIAIYDMSSKIDFNCQYKVTELDSTPLCLDFWLNPQNGNEAILVWGDVFGCVNAIIFSSASIALFERPPAPAGGKQDPCLTVKLADVKKGDYRNAKFASHNGHSGKEGNSWVRQVKYIPGLDCVISCATSFNNSMVIGWLEKSSASLKMSKFQIQQGINAIDFHPELNLIASAGLNHQVCLWNPYVVSKPNGVLRGHMAAVVRVQFIVNRNQLLSFSKDKVLRLWDVGLQVCIQRLAGMFPKGGEVYSTMFFDEIRHKLFITFNYQITVLEMKQEVRDRVCSHEKPVTAALYNKTYNQVVSVDQAGNMSMWALDTGQRLKTNNSIHGDAEVTSLAQDPSETRLYTGSTDGTIKVWDFNGHCYHTLHCSDTPADIGHILVLKRSVIAVGWARYLTTFRESSFKDFDVYPNDRKGSQEIDEDISVATFISPNALATGSYDGEIVIWNLGSERISRRLTARSKSRKAERTSSVAREVARSRHPTRSDQSVMSGATTNEGMESDFSIGAVLFLESRKSANEEGNLISCGANGWVRFWSIQTCKLVGEFVAHPQVGSIIMASDEDGRFLVTGDVEGAIKTWLIEAYCLSAQMDGGLQTSPPRLIASWSAHLDAVTSLEVLERYERTLVLSSSSDCSVALRDIRGQPIGVFGQDHHWKIEPFVPGVDDDFSPVKTSDSDESSTQYDEHLTEKDGWRPDVKATLDPQNFKVDSWQTSLLGRHYQETRKQKRERRQPTTIPDLPYLHWERTGAPPVGPFNSLETRDLQEVDQLKKPDFMSNPHKFFGEKIEEPLWSTSTRLPALSESLKTAFDEKTLLPKYILEYENEFKKQQLERLQERQNERQHALNTSKRGSVATTRLPSARKSLSKQAKGKALPTSKTTAHGTVEAT